MRLCGDGVWRARAPHNYDFKIVYHVRKIHNSADSGGTGLHTQTVIVAAAAGFHRSSCQLPDKVQLL